MNEQELLTVGKQFFPKLICKDTTLKDNRKMRRFFTHPMTNGGSHSFISFYRLLKTKHIEALLSQLGIKQYTQSTKGSYYFNFYGFKVRLSDHDNPRTDADLSIVVEFTTTPDDILTQIKNRIA